MAARGIKDNPQRPDLRRLVAERLRQTPTDALVMGHAELVVYSGFLCAPDVDEDNPS